MVSLLFNRKQDIGAGVGGVAQAGANIIDTQLTNQNNREMQQHQDEFNAQQADISRNFSAQQAAIQRQYQTGERVASQDYNTQMSNTQIQRRLTDLKQAGINPLLAATQLGGASSPTSSPMSGAMPGSPQASSAGNIMQSTQGMADAFQKMANLKQTNAQTANIQQDTLKSFQETRKASDEADILDVDSDPQMLMARSQSYMAKYNMTTDEAYILAQNRNLIVSQVEGQNLKNVNQTIQNNIDRMSESAKQATLTEFIQMQQEMYQEAATDARVKRSVEQGGASPFGRLSTAIGYLQATSTPITTAYGAGIFGAGMALGGQDPGGPSSAQNPGFGPPTP